jgi:hypothetical protein
VEISGKTFFGVRHGLETFTQLLAFNEFSKLLEVSRHFEFLVKAIL